MEWTLECTESPARPAVVAIRLQPSESVAVYALADALEVDNGLRATVLRRTDQDPPAGALLILELDLQESGGQPTLRVLATGAEASTDWLRPDTRTRVASGTLLRPGCRLEATLRRHRRVQFTLQASGESASTAASVVSGSGTRSSQALASANSATWLVPTVWKVLTDFDGIFIDSAAAIGKRFGLSARSVAWSTTLWFAFAGGAYAFYTQRQATQEAEGVAASTAEDLGRSEAARAVALESEQRCLVERAGLAQRLNDAEAAITLQAERAIAASASRGVSIELGGARMGSAELAAFDAIALADLTPEIAGRMAAMPVVDAGACLGQQLALGADLPTYLLLWFPDPKLACPVSYGAVVDGTSLAGRWGLSARVAREFGSDDPALDAALGIDGDEADPRANDRWSALTLARGAREVLTTLLRHDPSGREPVAPSQAQVWGLALFGAYNAMPTQADGVLDWKASACVGQLLDDLQASAGPAAPGTPLLPEISLVASGAVEIVARPTPGCPWPADAIGTGADAALRAVSRLGITPTEASKDVEGP